MILALGSCKTGKIAVDNGSENKPAIEDYLQFKSVDKISENTPFYLSIKNITDDTVVIHHPYAKRFYREGEEKPFRIIQCPCGAHCAPPPKYIKLKPEEVLEINWNLKEGYCKEVEGEDMPIAIENFVGPGNYKLWVQWGLSIEKKMDYYYKFWIEK